MTPRLAAAYMPAMLSRAASEPPPAPQPPRRGVALAGVGRVPLGPLALLAGAFAALGFEPVALFAPAFFGVAALAALIDAAPGRALKLGWLWGLGHFAVGCHWIAQSFTYQAKMPAFLGWVTVAGLAALLATMIAGAAWVAARAPARARPWAFALGWMLFEWTRGWLFTGFPWNPLAAALLPLGPVAHSAALWGALGLSGLVALAAAGLARRDVPALGAATTLLAVGAALTWAPAPAAGPDVLRLTIVQPNIGQDVKWEAGLGRHLAALTALSRTPPPPGPRAILWPEVALPGAELERDPALRAALATLLRPGDVLLTGGNTVARDARGYPTAATNSLFAIDASGRILGRYDKAHLVPAGEYVPLRPVADALGLSRLAPGEVDFAPGPGPRTLRLPGLPPVGPMICYEMIFPGAIVDRRDRPQWLLNPSNDAWFGGAGPPQHLAMARLRAIEEGLPVARSTPTGISALLDARGGVLARLPRNEAGALDVALPPPLPAPPFARLGHLTSLALAAALAAGGALAWRRRT